VAKQAQPNVEKSYMDFVRLILLAVEDSQLSPGRIQVPVHCKLEVCSLAPQVWGLSALADQGQPHTNE
jgi:hypothetical protein